MSLLTISFYVIGGLSFLTLALLVVSKIVMRRLRRKVNDRPIVENHKLTIRPPTWRFQKYHPGKCPHKNGVYRKISFNGSEQKIFICADCVNAIDLKELEHRDKFKNQH